MEIGRCCRCDKNPKNMTLKGLDPTDGTTVWEYGPGAYWRHHYGLDAITGIVPDVGATLDKYVLLANTEDAPVRSGSLPVANVAECLTITKLDSTDGTVIESAVIPGLFCTAVSGSSFATLTPDHIRNATALSGGDYVIQLRRAPTIEFVDFTTNTVNKSYILHPHNQRAGNVYLRTRTSNELITLAFDTAAAAVETAIEATSDCVAATVTGGPWPFVAISIDAEWSVSTGDIKSISTDSTYSVSGSGTAGTGTCEWIWSSGTSTWSIFSDNCTTGTATEPAAPGGMDGETGFGTCVIPSSTDRSVHGVAASYDTGTGVMVNAVGYEFGRNETTPDKLLVRSGSVPAYTELATLGIFMLDSADNDTVIVVPALGSGAQAHTIEAWSVAATWTQDWQKYVNAGSSTSSLPLAIHTNDTDRVCVSIQNTNATGGYRAAALIVVSTGVVTEVEQTVVSQSTFMNNHWATSVLETGSSSATTVLHYELHYNETEYPNLNFENHSEGGEVAFSGSEYLLGAGALASNDGPSGLTSIIGIDSTQFYAATFGGTGNVNYGPPQRNPALQGDGSRNFYWRFYLPLHEIYDTGTQWRFKFQGTASTLYTSWLAWYCTATDIQNAVLAVFPENSTGSVSNAEVYPFGAPSTILNADYSPLENNLDIIFRAAGSAGGTAMGFIPGGYVNYGRLTIEFQNITQKNSAGFGAWSKTDGSIVWQRTFGVSSITANTVYRPSGGWVKSGWVYVYGSVVNAGS